ncbi:MAG: methylenetetrahydrofolate reductase [Thalassobaculales bacterium]
MQMAPPRQMAETAIAASVELSGRAIAADPALLGTLPPGTAVYLVDTGETAVADWAAACRAVTAAGLDAVPHIACRRIREAGEISARLAAMAEAGARDALVIGGDIAVPAGPFPDSLTLLESGLLARHGFTRYAIAGHPEGSPDIPPAALLDALHRKIAHARRSGAAIRLVTQFGFDAGALIAWAARLAADGITVPVHAGVAGPAGMARLLRYAALCGVRASLSFALKRGTALASLATGYDPEPHARAIEAAWRAGRAGHLAQLHVYPFGGIAETARWLAGRGSWPALPRSTR